MDFSYLWENLKFNSASTATDMVGGWNWRIKNKGDSKLEFKSACYKSAFIYAAKRLLMQELNAELNNLIPKFKKHIAKKNLDAISNQRKANRQTLIEKQTDQSKKWGEIEVEGGKTVVAKDKYGTPVKESLIIYYNDEKQHTVEDVVNGQTVTYNTKTLFHIDLSAKVSMNSAKNIVMTQVQGRDYTRKELVSGGDLQFTVNGNIVSDEQGVYPMDAVKKFIKIMEYNGILKVNFMMFEPFGVKRIIIKDYSLSEPTYKNVQPYTFSCVAVEPDEDVQIEKDTIAVLNQELQQSPNDQWYQFILKNKLSELEKIEKAAATSVINTTSSVVVSGTGAGLDALIPNI